MFEMNEALPESMADVSHKQTQTHNNSVTAVWLDAKANCNVFLYEFCYRNEPKRWKKHSSNTNGNLNDYRQVYIYVLQANSEYV